MSNRVVRINELVQREISDILRRHFQAESVAVTVTEVRVAPDLRDGRIFVAVVGGATVEEDRLRWLRKQAAFIREELSRRIVLKYLPHFTYALDISGVRSTRLLGVLDEIERKDKERAGAAPAAEAPDTDGLEGENRDGRGGLPPA